MLIRPSTVSAMSLFIMSMLFSLPTAALETPEDLQHKPATKEVVLQFLDKYGYKKHKIMKVNDKTVITFSVQASNTKRIFSFLILPLPKLQLLKIECYNVAKVPTDQESYNSLLQKLSALNAKRTIGKYCLDGKREKVKYFYFRTVAGGICFADFKKTLAVMEKIVFSDFKTFKPASTKNQ